jgi:hypothetical protein
MGSISLAGPKVLLIGASGTGKTRSLGPLVDWAAKNGRKVRVLFTENSLETLLGYWRDRGLEVPDCLAYHVTTTPAIPLKSLTEAAKKVGLLSYKAITEMVDPDRSTNNPYLKILEVLVNFPDDRTGELLGNIGEWKEDVVFAVDSLSELANACMKMVIGSKPTASRRRVGGCRRPWLCRWPSSAALSSR